MTEREVARKIQIIQLEQGATGPSFPPIVAFGEHSAIPHHSPTERALKPGESMRCIKNNGSIILSRTLFPPFFMHLILSPSDIFYLTGVRSHDVGEIMILLAAAKPIIFCDMRTSGLFDPEHYRITVIS